MTPRTGKTITLKTYDNWKVMYGCFDSKNPLTMYIKLQTWITPISEDSLKHTNIIYKDVVNYKINNNSVFDQRFIQNVSFAKNKMNVNKQTCLVITLSIKQKNEIIPFINIKEHIILLLNDIIHKMELSWKSYFKLSPKN